MWCKPSSVSIQRRHRTILCRLIASHCVTSYLYHTSSTAGGHALTAVQLKGWQRRKTTENVFWNWITSSLLLIKYLNTWPKIESWLMETKAKLAFDIWDGHHHQISNNDDISISGKGSPLSWWLWVYWELLFTQFIYTSSLSRNTVLDHTHTLALTWKSWNLAIPSPQSQS